MILNTPLFSPRILQIKKLTTYTLPGVATAVPKAATFTSFINRDASSFSKGPNEEFCLQYRFDCFRLSKASSQVPIRVRSTGASTVERLAVVCRI